MNREKMVVKHSALKPGSSDRGHLSMIRGAVGPEEARQAAIDHVHREKFWGFGQVIAGALEPHCVGLTDDRETFYGHAEMELGYDIPVGPPNTPPEMEETYQNAMGRLIELAQTFQVRPDAPPENAATVNA